MKVDYSIYSDFSDPKTILEPTVITASMANFSLKNFISPLATDGQVVYVRVYFYNTYQVLNILFQDGNNVGPVFRGTVASSSTTPIATNDNVTTYINDDTKINVLANDDFSNTIDALVYTQPAHGITTLNPDNSIQYLPAKGYSGSDSFTYQIKNKFGDSNYAVVNINVVANTPSVLIRWDKNNYVASPQQLFLTATEMKVYGGVTRGIGSENTSVFIFGNIGNTNVDTAKYVEFVLDNTSTEKTVELQKFSFRGRGYNPGNYQVRHSKQQNFSSGVVTLPPGSYNASFNDQVVTFNENTKAEPGEKIYIRLYLYNNSSSYIINYRAGDLGPKIEGLFYNKVYSDIETIWQNAANPEWSNGVPTAIKNAIIETNYSTAMRGNFESRNLTIKPGGQLIINTGGVVTVNGQIVNNATTADFVVENDANLIQKTIAQNTGNITVRKSALLPKMGYNYWSSPVAGQNLYQFSDGYNQAAAPANPQGTPWNRFYVYNEATDFFVSHIPNEITLNAASVFQPARGYAIRGQNRFPAAISESTLATTFEFKGIAQNGDIFSYPLKWTNAQHGYNMVGNPYPSNINFDAFFEANITKMSGVIWLWTNNDSSITTQQGSSYKANNYASLSKMGGTSATYPGYNKKKPQKSLSVAQGFIVQAKEEGKNQALIFKNEMRNADSANYYNKNTVEKDRFWLELKSPTNINNEILIGYLPEATNGFDGDYDAPLLVVGSDSFWSIVGSHQLAIQARENNFNLKDFAKIGFKASVSGNFTSSLTDQDGIFKSGQKIYIKDNYLNKSFDITESSYTFNTTSGQFEDRFEIIFKPLETLATETPMKKGIQIYKDAQNFVITSHINLDEVNIYDALGRLIHHSTDSKKKVFINKNNFVEGLYIVKVKSGNEVAVKKILR